MWFDNCAKYENLTDKIQAIKRLAIDKIQVLERLTNKNNKKLVKYKTY